jgi:hypothetical protein
VPLNITYIGPLRSPGDDRGDVEIADSGQWARAGEPIEVETDLAEQLLEQEGNWAEADLGTATIRDVLAEVGDDLGRAQQALALEEAKGSDARKTLIEKLEAIVAANTEEQ